MAVIEGLCPNCGSLMRLNDEKETTHCIFCWAEVPVEKAIQLGKDSAGYVFPNESYSEPDAESQAAAFRAQGLGGGSALVAEPTQKISTPAKRQEGKLTPREKVALQNKPIVKPYCSTKHRIAILAGVVAFLIVVAVIALPTYFLRENKKSEIKAELSNLVPYSEDQTRINIQKQRNQLITLVSPEPVSEEEAVKIYEGYAQTYADVYEISLDDAKAKVEVKLIDATTGGFNLKARDGELAVTPLK